MVIVSDLQRVRGQLVLTPNLATAVTFLEEHGQDALEPGRKVIDGERVYAEVQAYETVEGAYDTFEGHRKYIDIQYVFEGEEIIGWTSIADVTESKSFDEAHDYWLATADAEKVTEIRLHGGQLAVFYPDDMHAPRRAAGSSSPVRKLVVKVAIE